MAFDDRLIRKGQSEPRLGLVEQAKVSAALATEHADVLAPFGWLVDDTKKLQEGVAELEADMSVQADKRAAASVASQGEQEGIDKAKKFLRILRNQLPRALRTSSAAEVSAEDFRAGGSLGRSSAKILGYLTRIRPHVAKLEGALTPMFGGKSPLTELDAAKALLEAADVKQEVARGGLPSDTAKLYETKGRVLEAIEDLNRAGKCAFDGDASKGAIWNKDVLVRARRRVRKKVDAGGEGGAGGTL